MTLSDIGHKWSVLGRSLHPHGSATYSWSYNLDANEMSVFRLMLAGGAVTTAKRRVEGGFELVARKVRK